MLSRSEAGLLDEEEKWQPRS